MREAALFCTEPQFSSNTSTCTMTAKLEVEFFFLYLMHKGRVQYHFVSSEGMHCPTSSASPPDSSFL